MLEGRRKVQKISNNNNNNKKVVPYILPLCKENLAKIVARNDQYNSVRKQLLTILEELEPTTKKETVGKLDSGTTSHFINKECPGKTVQHKLMTVGCANTTTIESIATKEIDLNLPLSTKGKNS